MEKDVVRSRTPQSYRVDVPKCLYGRILAVRYGRTKPPKPEETRPAKVVAACLKEWIDAHAGGDAA